MHTRLGNRIRGRALLREPSLNKGTGFSAQERRALALEGLLPFQSKTLEQQAARVYSQIRRYPDALDKYIALAALRERDETLFYRVLIEHIEEFMPVVYTPTVGQVTQAYSHVFQQGRGLWITPDMRGRIERVLRNCVTEREVRLLVVTDNEAVLGIGDQGAGGMAISHGKLDLYTAGAGIHPSETLPVSLDFGTDNEALLGDEQYLGWPHPRLRGDRYDALIEEFVEAVRTVHPLALIQWEDFRKDNALRILDAYRTRIPSFNDDIQGTGAVALAGLETALSCIGEDIDAQRIVVLGAGAGGLGIVRQIRAEWTERGVSARERQARVAVLDRNGLIVESEETDAYKREVAWPVELARHHGLEAPARRHLAEVVAGFRPTVLIGASGHGGAFTEDAIRAMARHTLRPIIFPCSNPTENSEARPEDLFEWTGGRCLVATGSPFADVEYAGRRQKIGQGNNVFIFPGLGLGATAVGARMVTDEMIDAASRALAEQVTVEERAAGLLFPAIDRLRAVSRAVAVAVGREAVASGIGRARGATLEDTIAARVWEPRYPHYEGSTMPLSSR
ncbi:MAG: NAD-dependent malic enzyme [Rhodospirillaceae bacterium]|nr:NAD-dependent malic enzyme [Rhodospirillaceae bacterium]